MIHHFPVQWPIGWDRTKYRESAQFKVSYEQAEKELMAALERLGATSAYISTDQELRMDGRPRRDRQPDSPAVAVYFARKGSQLCIPCDKFNTARDNLRAVGLTLENIRQMERYGTSRILEAALSGFKALPSGSTGTADFYESSPASGPRPWYDVLQVSQSADEEIVRAAWRRLTARYHPDAGTSADPAKYQEVQEAYNTYKRSN